jgi:hypothetical protein
MSSVAHLPRLVLLASLAAACASPTETTPTPPPGLTGPGPFVVSNAVTNGAVGAVTYISLPPGTLPGGTAVLIRVERTGMVVSPPLLDGGLDPVAVPAVAGDTVSLTVTRPAGTISVYVSTVPFIRPPVVVRTNPRKDEPDVPLGATTRVVFSEPIDAASLVPQNFELRSAGNPVAGQLSFGTEDHTAVEFTPFADLAGDTEYQLVLRPGIRDSDGTPLEAAPSISFTTEAQPVALTGSISGVVLDADTQEPVISTAWVRITGSTSNPPPPQTIPLDQPFAQYESDGSFAFGLLPVGRWTITVSAIHGFWPIFSGLNLYADTTLTVDVVADQTTVMPPLLLRPRPPLLLVGISTCPFGLPDPPTQDDWDNCDGGYWGGVNVDVGIEVNGVAGTATAGVHLATTIRPYGSKPFSFTWDDNFWSAPFNITIPGDYDVSFGPLLPGPGGGTWRLLPWETAVQRIRMERVVGLVQFGFWYK